MIRLVRLTHERAVVAFMRTANECGGRAAEAARPWQGIIANQQTHRTLAETSDTRTRSLELQAQAGQVVDGEEVFRKADERIKQRGRKRA